VRRPGIGGVDAVLKHALMSPSDNRTEGGNMKKKLAVALATAITVGVTATAASAYDRQPIVVNGLHGDSWGQSVTQGARNLMNRYAGIEYVYCFGASSAATRPTARG
jgi:ABC-type sugar transport system substrate-binding protein